MYHRERRPNEALPLQGSSRLGAKKDHAANRRCLEEAPLSGLAQGDEDVWVSPYVPEWRKIYMEHVRQIAATGIDGIYVDVPLLDDALYRLGHQLVEF